MKVEDVRKYAGKRVLLILQNNFKYTAVLPDEIEDSFSIIDKYGNEVTIDCSMIGLITENGGNKNGKS